MDICDLHQQTKETAMMYLVVIWIKTITSFWNMSRASAPIHMKATRLKYWIRADTVTQPPYEYSGGTRSMPIMNTSSMKKRAILSCTWNFVASRVRSFLQSVVRIKLLVEYHQVMLKFK